MCLDWWAFELLLLISGLFDVTQQSAQIILMNIAGLFYRVGMGLDQAGATLIGQTLGRGNSKQAHHFFHVFTLFSGVVILLEIIILFTLRFQIIELFTKDQIIK